MKDNKEYLLQILDFIDKIESYTQEGQDAFNLPGILYIYILLNQE